MQNRTQCPHCLCAHTDRGLCCDPCERRLQAAELFRCVRVLGAGLVLALVGWLVLS